jgi:hypothetical protein
MPLALIALVIFEIGFCCLLEPAWTTSSFYCWDEVLQTLCPSWPPTVIFPISAFWVARIAGINHPPSFHFKTKSMLCPSLLFSLETYLLHIDFTNFVYLSFFLSICSFWKAIECKFGMIKSLSNFSFCNLLTSHKNPMSSLVW